MAIDVASFFISLGAMYLATKKPTNKLSFGYIRAGLQLLNFTASNILNNLLCRSTRSSVECINNMVSNWGSCLHGY